MRPINGLVQDIGWLLLGKVRLSDACNRSGNQCSSIIVKWGRFKGVEEYLEDQSPLKIRHFMWRAAKDALPSKQNLARRKIAIDETCSLCDEQQESVMHVLWLCDQAKAVWKSVPSCARMYQIGRAHV